MADEQLNGIVAVTDAQGKAEFRNLPLGLYFVMQSNEVAGYAPCKSFLVSVPFDTGDGYTYAVDASPKTEVEKLADITIKKHWNTDKTVKLPAYITVQLLRDGAVVGTATLNEKNQWQTVFYDMPESDGYSVLEVDVPKGFTATYTEKGYVFTVINTPHLIQTGQLVWPIPVLALVGLVLIGIGAVVLRKSRNGNG